MKVTNEFVKSIFDIVPGNNIVDDDEEESTVNTTEVRVPFSDKTKEVVEEISRLSVVNSSPGSKENTELKKETPSMSDKNNGEEALKKAVPNKLFGDIFDEDDKKETPTVAPLVMAKTITKEDEAKAVEPEAKSPIEEKISEVPDTKHITQSVSLSDVPRKAKHQWLLNSPSPKYNRLYEEKRELLSNELLWGGEIPFNQFYKELGEANVDVNVSSFDTEEVGRRISEVQKWRDRIKFIQLHVNSQYFAWKHINDLLPGVLARLEYERGKQEGIVYEHLRDFTTYFGHLEGLHKSCEIVSKHLDGAYASLSRQVAIAQPLQEFERYSNQSSVRPPSPQMTKYDALKTQANNAGAVALSKQKDSPKGDEPQAGKGWGTVD